MEFDVSYDTKKKACTMSLEEVNVEIDRLMREHKRLHDLRMVKGNKDNPSKEEAALIKKASEYAKIWLRRVGVIFDEPVKKDAVCSSISQKSDEIEKKPAKKKARRSRKKTLE